MATQTISKKRKIVADGVFFAELNQLLSRELGEDGFSGMEVRVTPLRTEIIIRATRTQNVLGERGRRIRELTSLIQKRFNFPEGNVELYAERVANRALSAIAQAGPCDSNSLEVSQSDGPATELFGTSWRMELRGVKS